MIKEYENKEKLKDSWGHSSGTYTGTVIPSDLEKENKSSED